MTPIKVDSYVDIPTVIDQLLEIKRSVEEKRDLEEKLHLDQLKESEERNEVLTKALENEKDINKRQTLLLEWESNNRFNRGLRYHLAGEYLEASEEYKVATILNPRNSEAFCNWGTALSDLAKTKSGNEAEKLYHEAFEKYQWAIEYKPDFYDAYNNWGTALSGLAEIKTRSDAERLYNEAFKKYQKAIDYKSDYHQAYNNWGTALSDLAKTKSGSEAEELYDKAFENFQQAIKYGGGSYNLACLYALRNRKEEALKYLDHALSRGKVLVKLVEEDNDWDAFREDPDFKPLLSQYKGR